jgi:cytochrome c peroxidase
MALRKLAALLCITATGVVAQQSSDTLAFVPIDTIPLPVVKPEIAELGKMLFFDPRLSGDSSTSCAECHNPAYGWTDGSDLARGYPGTKHWRNSQSIVNAALIQSGLHWNGELANLTDQVNGAMASSVVANIDVSIAEERLYQIPDYRNRFLSIWGEEPNKDRIFEAIATYEATLISYDSPFDRYVGGDAGAMSESAVRGFGIFAGKGNCTSCHNGPLLSDQAFHNTAAPPNPMLNDDPLMQITFRYMMRNSGVEKSVYDNLDRDPGRYAVTKNPDDLGLFRTPPLRYLNYTAPYMHNGIFYTLEEVVEFYNIGGTQDIFGTKSPLIQPLNLTEDEKKDLVAFLQSLSGTEIIVETPELPDYEALAPPAATAVITAAALRGEVTEEVAEAVNGSQAGKLPEAPAGLRIETTGEEPGLAIVPRSSDGANN